jgi:hypothetical protein
MYRAGKFAALLDEACDRGLAFLKWPVLAERLRLPPRLIERLTFLGAGACRVEDIDRIIGERAEKELADLANEVKPARGHGGKRGGKVLITP